MYTQNELGVTPIEELIKAARGTIVELPPFAEGQRFVARLKRPSMLALIKAGKIPNALIKTANELFANSSVDISNDDSMANLFGVLDSICEACFVEPSYEQLKANGIELTDEQYMFVFNYTQKGITALDTFRQKSQNSEPIKDM